MKETATRELLEYLIPQESETFFDLNPNDSELRTELKKSYNQALLKKRIFGKTTKERMQELYRDYVRNEPKAEVVFDGRKLTWFENGKPVKSWPAMSGHADYQNVWSQGIKNKGPIPEGEWTIAA